MPFWKLYYHIVWATKDRRPMITPEIEVKVYQAVRDKVKALHGEVFEVNGTADHIHLAGSIPPAVSIAGFVGEIKDATAYYINHLSEGSCSLDWQKGYGVVSFRHDNLQMVEEYIRHQKEYHESGKLWPTLEDCAEDDGTKPSLVREERAVYDPFAG